MMYRTTSVAALAMAAGLCLSPSALAQSGQQDREDERSRQQQRAHQQQQERQRQQQQYERQRQQELSQRQPSRDRFGQQQAWTQDRWPGRYDEFPGRGNAYGARDRFDQGFDDPWQDRRQRPTAERDDYQWDSRDRLEQNRQWSQQNRFGQSPQEPRWSQQRDPYNRGTTSPTQWDDQRTNDDWRWQQQQQQQRQSPQWRQQGQSGERQWEFDRSQHDWQDRRTLEQRERTRQNMGWTQQQQQQQQDHWSQQRQSGQQSMQSSTRVTGTVQNTQVTTVRGEQHMIVSLETEEGVRRVDLGPVSELRQYRSTLVEGSPLVVSVSGGDGGTLAANTIEIDGREIPVAVETRTTRTYTSGAGPTAGMLDGTIQQVLVRTIEGDRHLVILLDSDQGPSWVDLGPLDAVQHLRDTLMQGVTLMVDAQPAPGGDDYLVARTINLRGQQIPLGTSTYQSTTRTYYGTSEPDPMGSTLSGTVQTIQVRSLDGDRHIVVLLDADRGPTWVDLGPLDAAREFEQFLEEGATLRLTAAPAPSGERYFVARQLNVSGRTIPIQTSTTYESRTYEQFSSGSSGGSVQAQSGTSLDGTVRTIQVRNIEGDRHIVVLLDGDAGPRWVDLGLADDAEEFRHILREGATLRVSASPAPGGKQYFVARQLNVEGQTIPIRSSTTYESRSTYYGTTEQGDLQQQSMQRQQEWQQQQQQQNWYEREQQQDRQQSRNQQGSQQDWQQQNWYEQNQQRRQQQPDWQQQRWNNQGAQQRPQQSPWGTQGDYESDRSTGRQYQPYYGEQEDTEYGRQNPAYRQRQNRAFDPLEDDQYFNEQARRQQRLMQDPPYGRAEGYRDNRGMDPLTGDPGRRMGQQSRQQQEYQRQLQQQREDERRAEQQRRNRERDDR